VMLLPGVQAVKKGKKWKGRKKKNRGDETIRVIIHIYIYENVTRLLLFLKTAWPYWILGDVWGRYLYPTMCPLIYIPWILCFSILNSILYKKKKTYIIRFYLTFFFYPSHSFPNQ
jgi:hypothetical protein